MGIIVSSFPGCGKRYLYDSFKDKIRIIYSDSNKFDKNNFSDNFINYIKRNIENTDIILVPSHKEVRDALIANYIDFDIFYPSKNRRMEFLINYIKNGRLSSSIKKIDENWNQWISEIENEPSNFCCKHELKNEGDFIGNDSQIIKYINKIINEKKN